jgi:hypothetical protein
MFAADHVQLVLTRPISINRTFDSPEAAVAFLRATLRVQQETEPPGTGRIAE